MEITKIKKTYMILQEAYRTTTMEQAVNNIGSNPKKSILAIDNNRLYAYNDGSRNVNVSDLNIAGAKVAQYINNNIRNGKDVNILAIDGTKLTITRETAYKIATRDKVKSSNGNYKLLSDDLYSVKIKSRIIY